MKRIKISFQEEDKETIYILVGNLFGDKKVLKEKIDEIIEFFGDYWHENTKEDDRNRLKTYSQCGYKTLVIWENELKNPLQIINKIKNFS